MAEFSPKSKSKESSLSILTNTQVGQSPKLVYKSLSRGLNDRENEGNLKPISNSRSYMTSFDDLIDHKKTLFTCYSSRAITMYNVSSNLKDYSGSTPNMFSLNKNIKTEKMSRSCSGEKSILSNVSASSQTISTNSTSMPRIKSFKDKIFSFKKNKTSQQWLDEFLRRNINDEKLDSDTNTILDSNTNLTTLFNITDYNSNYDLQNLYAGIMKAGDNYNYTLNHEPFWQSQPKIFPESDVKDIQSLSRELHIFEDKSNMTIEGIEYKEIDGNVIPYSGNLDAVMDCLIFPTAQETQFTRAFLEVYKFYFTSLDLLKFIISWFNVKLPKNATKDQEFFYDENRKNIQQRCLKLLNMWIRFHWHDFSSSAVMSLLNKFMNQVGDSINNSSLYAEYTKLDNVLRKQKLTLFTKQYTLANENSSSTSKAKFTVPNDSKKPWVLLMGSQEFGSQLLLHERILFKDIEPDYYIYLLEGVKLVDEDYGKFTLYKPIRIFLNYLSWFHQLSLYTITVIAEQPSVKKKHFALKKFIKVAKSCLNYKNYNSAAAIYYGLKNQLIVRHHALWESLPNELIENVEELDNILCGSYNYHFELQQLELKPYPDENVIPFIFEHVKQLVEQTKYEDKLLYDFNSDESKKDNYINTDHNNCKNENNDSKNNINTEVKKDNDSDIKKLNILNWLSVNQIIMEIEKWRLNTKNVCLDSSKNNNTNNIIGDNFSAEKVATHIINYPKWDHKKIIEQTLPYSLSLKSSSKSSSKKSSYTKYNSLQDVIAPSPLFYSVNELNSSPLSAPPLQYPQKGLPINNNPSLSPMTPNSLNSPDTPNTLNSPDTPNTAT